MNDKETYGKDAKLDYIIVIYDYLNITTIYHWLQWDIIFIQINLIKLRMIVQNVGKYMEE